MTDPSEHARPAHNPVFVLCSARSGSTLLRFVLDAHPDLACPPETNVPALCGQLATVWSLIAGVPLAPEPGEEPPEIPQAAISGVRRTADEMIGAYLERRGKQRYCDKSLGTARFADLLARVYPQGKFLCLYRHPMDVIASGAEACPWGLNGYGFDPYIAATPGNIVLALARYWTDNVAAILAVEERFADMCYRVRYEDFVINPEAVAAGIFDFLGVPAVPGITSRCFSAERERSGPADYKIWHTDAISDGSVGRGWGIPVGQIIPPVLEQVNALAKTLGYVEADAQWGAGPVPRDIRVSESADSPGTVMRPSARGPYQEETPLAAALVGESLRAGLARLDDGPADRWNALDPFGVVVIAQSGMSEGVRWRIDPASQEITQGSSDDDDGTEWDILGSPDVWQAVLGGRLNLGVALRRNELKYCDSDGAPTIVTAARIGFLAEFLNLISWQSMDADPSGDDSRNCASTGVLSYE